MGCRSWVQIRPKFYHCNIESLQYTYSIFNTRDNHAWCDRLLAKIHYDDVIMTTMASQITSLTVVYSIVYSDADERKHQSSASLAFVWGIHRDRWIPRTKGQLRGKCFHLMSSSCSDAETTLPRRGMATVVGSFAQQAPDHQHDNSTKIRVCKCHITLHMHCVKIYPVNKMWLKWEGKWGSRWFLWNHKPWCQHTYQDRKGV